MGGKYFDGLVVATREDLAAVGVVPADVGDLAIMRTDGLYRMRASLGRLEQHLESPYA